jgi:signal transduction histidine kinase/ActR/RegA family two-component response regulator
MTAKRVPPQQAAHRGAEALARSARFLAEALDVETVGRRIVESVCDLFELPSAGLRLHEPDGSLVLVASAAPHGPYMPLGHRAPPNSPVYGSVVATGQPLRVPDILADDRIVLSPETVERVRRSDERSLLAVALLGRQRIVGVLSVTGRLGRTFADDEVALLQAFADQAALALENSRSLAELVRRQHETEELARVARLVSESLDPATVGERIVDGVLGLLTVHSSALRLLRPDGALEAIALGGRAKEYATAGAIVRSGTGLVGLAAAEGRPVWTEDFRADTRFRTDPEIAERNGAVGIVSGLAVPLRVAGRVVGVLSVGNPMPRVFTDREVGLLEAFADQAAVAITNAQAQAALARQAERLRILHEIDRALIAQQAPVAIAEAVVEPLRELLGVPRVIVNLFDFETNEVEWLAAAGRRRLRLGGGVRYSIRLAGDLTALRRGEPQIMEVPALPPGPDRQALLDAGLKVYAVVPMLMAGELIGSVSVCDETGPFPPERIRIAEEMATQLAIAIGQARLHERVRQQAADLERRVEERTAELSAATAEADRANRAKSEFLGRMSHELRTPLNAILGFGQLLEMGTLAAKQREGVEHILRAGRHLLRLIDEVLDISRIEAGRLQLSLEPVPVEATLRHAIDLVRPLARAHDVSVQLEPVDERLHVLADRQRLQQVLLNFLSNAIKYNRAGGTVTASCARGEGSRLAVTVTDTGPGIAPDKLARLFVPFDRLGAEGSGIEGTGLGLALSKSLVEAMGGAIRVQSREDEGSTFAVELLLVAGPVEAADAAPVPAPVPGDSGQPARTVLYIEDNVSNLRLVESVLSHRPGVHVLSAMLGGVGLELARHHRPDLILLDRHLPDIAGDQVFALLREDARTRHIPVVILSADAIPEGALRLLDAGVREYLTKPLDVRKLLAVVDETLGRER